MQKDWFAILKVKVTARAHMFKIWQFLPYLLNCLIFCYQIWFDSTLPQARVSYGEIGLLCSRSRSQWKFKMLMNVCPDDVFWTAKHFGTKLGIVMHHQEPEYCAKRLVGYFQGQGHSKGTYDQSMTVSIISFELIILSLPNLVWWHIIISQSVLWRNWIAVFQVKVTAKLLSVSEFLFRQYLLNC